MLRAAPHARAQTRGSMACARCRQTSSGMSAKEPAASRRAPLPCQPVKSCARGAVCWGAHPGPAPARRDCRHGVLAGACAQGESAAPAAQSSGLQPGGQNGESAPPSPPCISCRGSAAACGAGARASAATPWRACGTDGAILAPKCSASPAPGAAPCAALCTGPSEVWSTRGLLCTARAAGSPTPLQLAAVAAVHPTASSLGTPLPSVPAAWRSAATECSLPRRGAAEAQPYLCEAQYSHARSRRPSSCCVKGASL